MIFFEKGNDKSNYMRYTHMRCEGHDTDTREWRNWQTRTFEGRVDLPYGFKSRFSHHKGISKKKLMPFLYT